MFRQDSDKAPVTFRDVAAYFSDDEWKLLHEWQKELYSNVMKEIHQAMVSLGPLIATSVFSLRAKEKEDLCLAELDDSERRYVPDLSQSTSTNPVALSGIHREKNLHVAKPLDSEVEERNDSLSTGFSYLNPDNGLRNGAESRADIMDHSGTGEESSTSSSRAVSTSIVSFCIKEEVEGYSKDHLDSEGSEHTSSHVGNPFLNVDFCLRKEEVPSTCLRDRLVSEGGQTTRNSSGNDDFTTVHIKREQEAYPIVLQETDREESVSSPVGINMQQQLDLPPRFVQHPNPDDGIMNRHCTDIHSVAFTEPVQPCVSSPGASNEKEFPRCRKLTFPRRRLWTQENRELKERTTAQCEGFFSNPAPFTLHQSPPEVGVPFKYNDYELNQMNAIHTAPLQNTQHRQRSNMSTQYDKNTSLKEGFIRFRRTHTGMSPRARPYSCAHCEKSFSLKSDRNRHQRIHTGEKPYTCVDCQKRFSRKDHFNKHRRIHIGEEEKKAADKTPNATTHMDSIGW
ncbi:zinc finger protein 777-like isoform X2 [Ambystoma mexicanum]|uniref:zinc finger protein 777-like isoform X2 n=1 Tax=Ambystoma mexicanum TaxID=8296 RepID=UPI0037E9A886